MNLGLCHRTEKCEELCETSTRVVEAQPAVHDLLDPAHPIDFRQIGIESPLSPDPVHRSIETECALCTDDEGHDDEAVLAWFDDREG